MFKNRNREFGLAALAALFVNAGAALALPSARTIEYRIRETPSNPNSAVVFRVKLDVHAVSQSGDTVTWEIDSVWVRHDGAGGSSLPEWQQDSPEDIGMETTWIIVHADGDNPVNSEFDDPPALDGTLPVAANASAPLIFEFNAEPSSSGMYDGNVANSTFKFALNTEPEDPIDEGNNEPTETSGGGT